MKQLIKILIISDDIEKWASFFKGYHIVITRDNTTIQGGWFCIRLRKRISENIRGEKYDKVIIDKVVSDEILYTIVSPMATIPKIEYTKYEYKFGKENN